MKRLFWISLCCMSAANASAADFHVSPDGSDENPATVAAPVMSLEKARDLARAARKAKPGEPIQILLHPGIYMVRRTVEFTKDDSGTASAQLTIKAWQDPKSPNDWPKLVGGVVETTPASPGPSKRPKAFANTPNGSNPSRSANDCERSSQAVRPWW